MLVKFDIMKLLNTLGDRWWLSFAKRTCPVKNFLIHLIVLCCWIFK